MNSQLEDKRKAAQWARDLLTKQFIVLDTESTGANKDRKDQAVQISVIDQHGNVLLNTLVQPTIPVDPDAEKVHGITKDMLKGAPAFKDILPELLEKTAGKVVVAYNAPFDRGILGNMIALLFRTWVKDFNQFYTWTWDDAMLPYAAFYGEPGKYSGYRWQKLTVACEQQGIPVVDAHDALGDVRMTLALINKMAEFEKPLTVEEVIERCDKVATEIKEALHTEAQSLAKETELFVDDQEYWN